MKNDFSKGEKLNMNRRTFVRAAAGIAGALALGRLGFRMAAAAQTAQVPLPAGSIAQFVHELPDLHVIDATNGTGTPGAGQIVLEMNEFLSMMLPVNTVPGYKGTWVWGYREAGQQNTSYIGPVILAKRNVPVEMKFVNNLGSINGTNVDAYKYSTDPTLHWADPLNNEANMCAHMAMYPSFGSSCSLNYGQDPVTKAFTNSPVPAVVHLHGGEVPPQLDGGPDAWVTSDGAHKGHSFYSADGNLASNYHIYRYPNTQEAAPIWFHDHTLGATRLNVYAGLAGAYLISDKDNDPSNLPELIPLVIQDRMFDKNGQLFFPADSAGGVLWTLNPEHPYWVPEFVGDVIVVNGKTWPYKSVLQKRYTLLFLNGSNARTYEMFLVDPVTDATGPNMWVIGTDGGYLDKPVMVKKLTMMPGERYQVIIDFNGFPGTWLLKNTAKTPFPGGRPPQGSTAAMIMQFIVGGGAVTDTSFDPAALGAVLRNTPVVRLTDPTAGKVANGVTIHRTRQLTLNEVMGMPRTVPDPVTGLINTVYPGGPLELLVNNTKWSGERITGVDAENHYIMQPIPGFTAVTTGGITTYYSETPQEGETELWEIVNLTADAHPIHLHLVQFQLLNRQNFNKNTYIAGYNAAFPAGYDFVRKINTAGGVYLPAYGPPLDYSPSTASGNKYGGNPDVGLLDRNSTPVYLQGKIMPPEPHEAGWKDTVIAYPGQVTRIVVRWAPTHLPADILPTDPLAAFPFDPNGGHGYVWHCHIIDHEDNEMMRPDSLILNPNAPSPANRILKKGTDY